MQAAVESLSVDVDLDVTVDGAECTVWSEGDLVIVNAPTLSAARSLLSGVEALPVAQSRLTEQLSETDLTIEIRVRYAPVARVGSGVVPSRIAAAAGYEAALSLGGVGVAAWRWLL
jgi:hypothetical protein